MSLYSVVIVFTVIVYSTLLAGVLRDKRTKARGIFIGYVVVAMCWSLSALMASLNILGLTRVWVGLVVISGICVLVAYYHFVRVFVNGTSDLAVKLGYAFVAFVLVPLAVLGYIPQRVSIINGTLNIWYGSFLYLMIAIGAVYFLLSVSLLLRSYKAINDPLGRNRIAYLLGGLGILLAFSIRNSIPPVLSYPIEQIGHLGNALVIGYAITKYKLLDTKLLIRKGLIYSLISILITALFLLMLYGVHSFIQGWSTSANLAAIFSMALLMAWIFNPLRMAIQRVVDKLFYGESYDYRQMVLSFARRMNSVLDLTELAEAMLKPITKALGASQVSLLLSDEDGFSSQFAERLVEGEPVTQIKLNKESPVVVWLTKEEMPLSRDHIDMSPEFKVLLEVERRSLDAQGIELFCPIKSKAGLVGILALSKKRSGGSYSSDDIDLLMTVATEAGVVIENAQLYSRAKERAHTDELTGLFNHRYFHENKAGRSL